MALNFLGLGFNFGAKDQGLAKFQEQASTGFFQIQESLNRIGDISEAGFGQLETTLTSLNSSLERIAKNFGDTETVAEQAITNIKDDALTLSESMEQSVEQSFDSIGDQFEKLGADAISGIGGKWTAAFAKGKAAIGGGKTALTGLGEAAFGVQKSFTVGVFDTLKKTGFFFKRRSQDIRKGQENIAGGFGEIKTVVRKLNQILKVNKLQGMISAISLGTLGKIGGAIGKLGSEGMNLTTSLEAMGVANTKTSRQVATNLGLTGKEMKKVSAQASGMAISLNIGADQATQAIVAFNREAELMGEVGIKSASDLAKITEVTGLNAKAFGEQLKQMESLGLAGEDIKGVVASFTSMGQATQDVGGALSSLPDTLELIQTKAVLMGRDLDPRQLASFAKQTASLSAGLGKFGIAADKARSVSQGLAEAQVGAQKEFANLFAGTGEGLPSFIKELAITAGDSEAAFDLISQGPAGMVRGLESMVKNAQASGADMDNVLGFMRARLEKAGIANADLLVNFLAKGGDEAKAQMKATENATESIAKLGREGFSTGRTLQESFDLAKDAAIAHFRAGGKASKTFLRDFTASATQFNKILDETSKKGGPLGQFVDKLRDVHRLGAAGLLPKEMQGAGVLLGEVTRQLGPLLGLIGGAIAFFPGLTAVLGPVVSILGIFAINLFKAKLAGESWREAFSTAFKNTAELIKSGIGFIVDAFKVILREAPAILSDLGAVISEEFDKIDWQKTADVLLEGGKKALTFLLEGFATAQGKINEVLGGIDFAAVFGKIFATLGDVMDQIPVEKVTAFIQGIADLMIERVSIIVDALFNLISAALDFLAEMDLSSKIASMAGTIGDLFIKVIEAVTPILTSTLTEKVPEILDKLGPLITKILKELPGKIGEELEKLDVGPMMQKLMPALLTFIVKVVKFFQIELPLMLLTALPDIVMGLGKLFLGAISFVQGLLLGALKGIRDWLVEKFPSLGKILDPLIEHFEGFLKFVGDFMSFLLLIITGIFQSISDIILGIWDYLFGNSQIVDMVSDAFDSVKEIWEGFVGVVEEVVDFLLDTFKAWFKFFGKAWEKVVKIVKKVWDKTKRVILRVWDRVTRTWGKAKKFFGDLFEAVKTKVVTIFNRIRDKVEGVWDKIKETWGKAKGYFKGLFNNVWEGVKKPFDKLKEIVIGVWCDVKEMWGKAKGFFARLWTNIQNAVTSSVKIIGKQLDKALGPLSALFESIDGWVETLFRNSIHDDIKEDMVQSVGVIGGMSEATTAILKHMNKEIHKVFKTSFDFLTKKTTDFVDDELKVFQDFLSSLSSAFASTFLAIATLSDSLTKVLAADIGVTVDQLTQIKKAFQRLEEARTRAARAAAEAVREQKAETVPMEIPSELTGLASVVDRPDWYDNTKDGLKKVLEQEFGRLTRQVAALERGPAQGQARVTPEQRSAAFGSLRRAATGTTGTGRAN